MNVSEEWMAFKQIEKGVIIRKQRDRKTNSILREKESKEWCGL